MIHNHDKISQENIDKVKKLEKSLDYFRKMLEKIDYINDKTKFFKTMQKFDEFVSNFNDAKTFKIFEHSRYFSKYRNFFSSQQHYYVRTLEAVEAVSIMTKLNPADKSFIDLFDIKFAKEMYLQVNDEFKLLDLTNCQNMIMVGSGPLPETILYVYENSNIKKIIGLDNNQEAIYMAGEMINSIINSDRIKLLHYNGLNYDYSNADIVWLANFIEPKQEILNRIVETANDNVQILVRNPILLTKMFYQSAISGLNPRLVIEKKVFHKYSSEETLLLRKLNI